MLRTRFSSCVAPGAAATGGQGEQRGCGNELMTTEQAHLWNHSTSPMTKVSSHIIWPGLDAT